MASSMRLVKYWICVFLGFRNIVLINFSGNPKAGFHKQKLERDKIVGLSEIMTHIRALTCFSQPLLCET